MKRAKRLLCVLLTLCMVLGMFPMTALAAGSLPFTDVKVTDWYYDEVRFVYENGMMKGTGGGKFSPDASVTRAMVVTILHRLEGEPIVGAYAFNDVSENDYFFNAVAWANGNGIVKGYGGGKFAPNDPITREQLATILYRYANYTGRNVSARADLSVYQDNGSLGSYAKDAMAWAVAEGLISGMGGKQLNPTGTATRAQVAAILSRFSVDSTAAVLPLPVNPGNGGFFPGEDTEYTKEETIERMQYVDEVLESELYEIDGADEMSVREKAILAERTLNSLMYRGYIEQNSIVYSEEQATITFQYSSGALGVVFLEEWYNEPGIDPEEDAGVQQFLTTRMTTFSRSADRQLTDCSAVILWSFENTAERTNFYRETETSWENQGLDTTVIWGATVDDYLNLAKYDVVVISGHGGYVEFSHGTQPVFALTEAATTEKMDAYWDDVLAHNLAMSAGKFLILPGFFREHYSNRELDGTFVFSESCESVGVTGSVSFEMVNAFMDAGASSYIGFVNSVLYKYSRKLMKAYVDGLIDGKEASAAFSAAKNKHGEDDWFFGRELFAGPTATPLGVTTGDVLWKEADAIVDTNYRYGYFVEDTQDVNVENGDIIENGVVINPGTVPIYTYCNDIVDFDGKSGNKTSAKDQSITKATFNILGAASDGGIFGGDYDYIGTLAKYERNGSGEFHIVTQAEQAAEGTYLVSGASKIYGTQVFTGANTQFMVRVYNWNTREYQYTVYVGYNNLPMEQFGSQANYAQTIQYLVGNNGIATYVFIDVK